MKRKYIHKYYPSSDENFTSAELFKIVNNIKKYENKRFYTQAIPWLVLLVVIFLYLFLK